MTKEQKIIAKQRNYIDFLIHSIENGFDYKVDTLVVNSFESELSALEAEQEDGEHPLGEYQICPKCIGQGHVWFPPNMPWNQTYSGNGEYFECDVCKGEKIIERPIAKPNTKEK